MPGLNKPYCVLCACCLLFICHLPVQAQVFRIQDEAHYQQLQSHYQNWLEINGLSTVLRINKVKTEHDQLQVFLQINYPEWEVALNAWELLKQQFFLKKGYPIEKLLFFTACNVYKVPPPRLELYIQDVSNKPNLKVDVKFNFASRKVKINQQSLLLRNFNPNLDIGMLENKPLVIKTKLASRSTEEIYEMILKMAKDFYDPKINKENQRYGKEIARFSYVPANNDVLEFAVIGLRQEVLKDEDNLWIGNMLNWILGSKDYDWRKVEHLRFYISCKKNGNNQLEINCSIDCRYGSGVFKTTDWQKGISMEPEFGWYVTNYTDDIKVLIYQLLTK